MEGTLDDLSNVSRTICPTGILCAALRVVGRTDNFDRGLAPGHDEMNVAVYQRGKALDQIDR
jgi:hypothetical protein